MQDESQPAWDDVTFPENVELLELDYWHIVAYTISSNLLVFHIIMVAAAPLVDGVTIGSSLITVKDHVLPIYDPIKKGSFERMVLNSGRHWNVLVFYPADFSYVCPTELRKLNELYPQFMSENAEPIGISRDSVLVHEKWIETEKSFKDFKIKLVSDREGILGRDIGLIHAKTGEYERVSMIVGPSGQVGYIEVCPANVGRNIEELLRKVQALNHAMQHPEIMCPEAWKPGLNAISPGGPVAEKKKQFTHE